MREFFSEIRTERGLFVFLGAIFLLTILGPFGSYEALTLMERFIFWTAVISAVGVPMHFAVHVALGSERLGGLPRLARLAIGVAVAAIPGTGFVFFVCAVLWPRTLTFETFVVTWFEVTAVGFTIAAFRFLNEADPVPTDAAPEADTPGESWPPARRCRFQDRLDPSNGTDIVSLSMQDHYVEVTTTGGTELVLIRFSDALAELDGLDGLRIHRSHWAAVPHVTALTRDDGRLRVRLTDGRSLPVSATYAKALRARLRNRGVSA